MDISQHYTQSIKLDSIKPVNDRFYRVITIRTDKNETIEITLFANQFENLEVTL